jgi:C1A family cysteine protease
MSSLTIALVIASVFVSSNSATPEAAFESFLKNHRKTYKAAEKPTRFAIWNKTKSEIEAHNEKAAKGEYSYTMALNQFSDLTEQERKFYLGYKPKEDGNRRVGTAEELFGSYMRQASPASLDLRTSQCMPAIKDQAQCGSCWAFAATTPIEYQYCMRRNLTAPVLLSEQQLVDCSSPQGNLACNGGNFETAWYYINVAGGQASSSSYPYTALTQTCTFPSSSKPAVAKISNYFCMPYNKPNETAMIVMLQKGPIAVSLYVSDNFQNYASGIFSDPLCSTVPWSMINHAVVIVGYGTLGCVDYWILRNQWGTSWGMAGYMYMKRGVDMCYIADEVCYPIVSN